MKDYSKSKIYLITCLVTDLKYVGATTMYSIFTRLLQHVYAYRTYANGRRVDYCRSFEIIKNNNFKIELLEECPCETQEELDAKERYYIESIECINKNIPSRTLKEYYQDKIHHFKDYYQRVKDNERFKKKILCSCGSYYTLNNKNHHYNTHKHQHKINFFSN
jgi:hypothetical protein